MGKIEFAIASPAITPADLDRVRDKGAPIGRFHEWMRLMMRWSNDSASSRCILALGYFYINGLFATSGFFNAGKGLWISGDYATHDWVRTEGRAHCERRRPCTRSALGHRARTQEEQLRGQCPSGGPADDRNGPGHGWSMLRLAPRCAGWRTSFPAALEATHFIRAEGRSVARQAALSSKIGFGRREPQLLLRDRRAHCRGEAPSLHCGRTWLSAGTAPPGPEGSVRVAGCRGGSAQPVTAQLSIGALRRPNPQGSPVAIDARHVQIEDQRRRAPFGRASSRLPQKLSGAAPAVLC